MTSVGWLAHGQLQSYEGEIFVDKQWPTGHRLEAQHLGMLLPINLTQVKKASYVRYYSTTLIFAHISRSSARGFVCNLFKIPQLFQEIALINCKIYLLS